MNEKELTIAAVGDIHVGEHNATQMRELFTDISEKADILLLCGDLTNNGNLEEAEILARQLTNCRVPVVAVLGNHDFDKDRQDEITQTLERDNNVHVLDGDCFIYQDVGFAGIKGFAGGFGTHMLGSFGEQDMKSFVRVGVEEALKLETALSKLETDKKVAVMHYAPIPETIQGEPKEIHAFLGTSRLAEPLNQFKVRAAFHGHAHKGTHKGKTFAGIPVYNVAMPIMQTLNKNQPYALIKT